MCSKVRVWKSRSTLSTRRGEGGGEGGQYMGRGGGVVEEEERKGVGSGGCPKEISKTS